MWKLLQEEFEDIPNGVIRIRILKKNKQHRIINTWNSLPENVISAKDMKIFEHRLDKYWKDQDLLYNYESNLTTGEEIEIDEEKELSIVVDGQRSETDL